MYKTCEERIDKELKRVIGDIKRINNNEDPIEALNNYALALSEYKVYKLELSWGGPSDYIEFTYNPVNKELVNITYHFLDWYDGAKRNIPYNTEEWKILEELFYNTIFIE